MASLTEQEVALEAQGDIRTPTGIMSWTRYKETLREKLKTYLTSHGWPENDLAQNHKGEFLVPSLEHMYEGYTIAHQQLHAGFLNLD